MTEDTMPPAARLVRDFVNTHEPQTGDERLGSANDLRDWLAERQLLPEDAAVEQTDLVTAVTVREGLRNVLLGHAGHELDPESLVPLRAALSQLPVRLEIDAGGYRLVATRPDPVDQALGQLLDAIRQSIQDGSWPRLKVCARDTCHWAFYDASRNQVRRWCSMAGCGNYVKMRRAYAARKGRAQATATNPLSEPS